MNLQTTELFLQALKEDICFYACEHYLLSQLGKFPLFENLFDLFFVIRRQSRVMEFHFGPAREEWTSHEQYLIYLFILSNKSERAFLLLILVYLPFEMRKLVYKALGKIFTQPQVSCTSAQ